jgi:hypothetical protein
VLNEKGSEALKLRSAGFSFAAIANSLSPPVSKQYVHKLFWKAIDNLNRERREKAEKWRAIVEACERMDAVDVRRQGLPVRCSVVRIL